VNIRSASQEVFTIVDQNSGAVLETVDRSTALSQAHTGAIYLHQGDSYLITQLNLESGIAYATESDAPYYTQTREITDIRILGVREVKDTGSVLLYVGDVEVTGTVIAFKKKAHFSEEVLGEECLDLPPRVFRTVALWFDVPNETLFKIEREKADLAGGLHAAEHTAIGVLPLFAMCDRNDIGGVSTPLHPDTGRPSVFIYDGHSGGVGIAERGYEVIQDLWQATLDVLTECPCEEGCPSCVQSPKCGNNNQPLDKAVAAQILRSLLEAPATAPSP
jgi:DEAD/DEAH box helicase domain-containing protein